MAKKATITILGLLGSSVFMNFSHFHSPGETLKATELYSEPGGKGSNQAVAAARLGAEVNFISCMGKDIAGKECIDFMCAEKIHCNTEYTSNAASPYACILTDSTGENHVTVYSGSADYLSAAFVENCENAIAEADILLLNNECPVAANLKALEIAEKHGVKAILNPAPYQSLPERYLERYFAVTPNLHEAAMLSGSPNETNGEILIHNLLSAGVKYPIITMGPKGALVWDGNRTIVCPAPSVTAKDTTGAGDCFNGALCCALAEGSGIENAVLFAVLASAYSVQLSHVMPSLPYRTQIEQTMSELKNWN